MRSSRAISLVALTGAALLGACSDSTGPSGNVAPTADFTYACSDLVCTFTDHSSDADGSIASREWNFGDGQQASGPTMQHSYAAAGTYSATVTATDNGGMSTTSAGRNIVVTASSQGGPHASFTASCTSLNCTVTNTSTATGAVVTWAWDFGDGQTSTAQNPPAVHYDVTTLTSFTITLVVTSDGQTSQASQQVTPTPPATLKCGGVDCTLSLDQASTVRVTLQSRDCQAHGNTFVITAPAVDTLFTDGCYGSNAAPGSSFDLNHGAAYSAGTQLAAEVLTGVAGAHDPQLRVTGDFANGWTLAFDDGFVGSGEPDFNDLVILVKATPIP